MKLGRQLRITIYRVLGMLIFLSCGSDQGRADDFRIGLEAYQAHDYRGARQSWQEGVDKGNSLSEYALGYLYDLGIGVPENPVKAADYYSRAGADGIGAGYFNLGLMYLEGRGISQDLTATRAYWSRAASLGVKKAVYGMGVLYYEGIGVDHDPTEAANWLRRAAEQGYSEAEYLLGEMLIRGLGLSKDEPAGATYLARAAARGHHRAKRRLARLKSAGQASLIPQVKTRSRQKRYRLEREPKLPPLPEASPIAGINKKASPFPLPQDNGVQPGKDSSTIRLWIGSYTDQDKAQERWTLLKEQNPQIFKGLGAIYPPRLLGGLRMFHLMIGPVTDRDYANDICNKIEKQRLASYCRPITE